ncbi:MAG: response regulator [Nitrosopumilus sp.]|nr:response regulator [Nitrosopumilus sp.]MDH3341557.1 response regulator [Nitrosopumilus sp.]
MKGFFVTTESSLKASLRRLKKELYDVVFVDAPLEDYDEVQILLHLKENKIFQKTNVLLFSYLDFDSAELNKWKNHGLYSYLKKPVKRNVIIKTLDDLRFKTSSEISKLKKEIEYVEELTV